jgi:hypothetical protein
MLLNKLMGSATPIRRLIAGLTLTLSTSVMASTPSLHDNPVDGMDCTPVTVPGTPGTAAGKLAVRKLTAAQLAKAEAEYRKLTPEQRAAKDKAFIAARAAQKAALERQAIPGTPDTTRYSCTSPNAPVVPRFTPEPEQNFTPAPRVPLLPPGLLVPNIPVDPTDPCVSFRDQLKDADGKFIESRIDNAWRDLPGMAKKCELPPPGTPVVTPPVGTPPGGIDCRDYTHLPPDRKPDICQPTNTVPEPGTLALAFVALASIVLSRMRKSAGPQAKGPKV